METILRGAGILESEVVAYADGACYPNPGPGGWAAILLWFDGAIVIEHQISGGTEYTTNNRMEMQAVLEALKVCKRPVKIVVYSDSQYVVHSIGTWIEGKPDFINPGWLPFWKSRGWRTVGNKKVKNQDLWEALWEECSCHCRIEMKHVKGHSGVVLNERCDELAVSAKRRFIEIAANKNKTNF